MPKNTLPIEDNDDAAFFNAAATEIEVPATEAGEDELVVDFSIDPSIIKPGKYLARAKPQVQYKTSKNGNKMMVFQYAIASDGNESNKVVWHNIVNTPQNAGNVRRVLMLYGATPEELQKWRFTWNEKGNLTNRIFTQEPMPLVALTIENQMNEQTQQMQNSIKKIEDASTMPNEQVLDFD